MTHDLHTLYMANDIYTHNTGSTSGECNTVHLVFEEKALSWNTGRLWGQVAQSVFEILSEMLKPKALGLIYIQDLKPDDNTSAGRFFEFFNNLQFQFIKILKIKEPPISVFWNF
jgi:hypothetical protein